jgi:hypothetical protein
MQGACGAKKASFVSFPSSQRKTWKNHPKEQYRIRQ